jgi:putative tricarboxylic transport membrane protein
MTSPRLIGGISTILLSLAVWFQADRFPNLQDGHPGPALFPKAVAIALLLCGIYLTVEGSRAGPAAAVERTEREPIGPAARRIGAVLAAIAAYPFAHEAIGFVPTVGAICFLVAVLLDAKPLHAGGTALGATVVIYLLFTQILGVPL